LLSDFLRIFEDIIYFEKYTASMGFLQRVNPLVKLLSLATILFSAILARTIYPLAILFVLIIILCVLSKIPLGYFLKRVTLFIPIFAAVMALTLAFITPGTALAQISVGPVLVQATLEGFQKAALFAIRIWICVSTLNLLILTTKFTQIIQAMNKLRIPRIFTTMTAMTYRFIFLFIDEAYRMIVAKESRTVRTESRLQSLKAITNMFSTLFVRAYEKGERVYFAMLARGFDTEAGIPDNGKTRWGDWLFLVVSFAICAIVSSTDILRLAGR